WPDPAPAPHREERDRASAGRVARDVRRRVASADHEHPSAGQLLRCLVPRGMPQLSPEVFLARPMRHRREPRRAGGGDDSGVVAKLAGGERHRPAEAFGFGPRDSGTEPDPVVKSVELGVPPEVITDLPPLWIV